MKPEAKFHVRILNEHWMVCTPLNNDAQKLINGKKAALRPIWSPEMAGNPEEERREIIRKANALSPAFHDPLI